MQNKLTYSNRYSGVFILIPLWFNETKSNPIPLQVFFPFLSCTFEGADSDLFLVMYQMWQKIIPRLARLSNHAVKCTSKSSHVPYICCWSRCYLVVHFRMLAWPFCISRLDKECTIEEKISLGSPGPLHPLWLWSISPLCHLQFHRVCYLSRHFTYFLFKNFHYDAKWSFRGLLGVLIMLTLFKSNELEVRLYHLIEQWV